MITKKPLLPRRPVRFVGFSITGNNYVNRWPPENRQKMRSQMKKYLLNITLLVLVFTPALAKASDQSDVRATVQSVFEQLKARQYSALYDLLPNASRNRMSRDRFVSA